MWINVVKEFGVKFLSFNILGGSVVYYLAKILKIKYRGYKFSNPKKSALYAIAAITISTCMITGLMILSNSKNTSQVASSVQPYTYNLGMVINSAISWLILLSPILIMKKVRKETWATTGVSKHNYKESILIGAILGIITLVIVILYSSTSLSVIRGNLNLSAFWALFNFAVAGFAEEFMYRGYLQIRLMEWIGKWKGLILTSMVMALIHIPQRMAYGLSPNEAIISAVLLIPMSLIMGYTMIKTENILAPGIYHTFYNWINVLM
ncbi:MAG TPA: CPBP family intramembrane glutamic endopeptidase [Clostridium sp.]|uniref:CPBP family intramembrane glutamic endopeptidase n=1 Tax=Clostridium sp. TaxID=1506 RepID=UPI002F946F66